MATTAPPTSKPGDHVTQQNLVTPLNRATPLASDCPHNISGFFLLSTSQGAQPQDSPRDSPKISCNQLPSLPGSGCWLPPSELRPIKHFLRGEWGGQARPPTHFLCLPSRAPNKVALLAPSLSVLSFSGPNFWAIPMQARF